MFLSSTSDKPRANFTNIVEHKINYLLMERFIRDVYNFFFKGNPKKKLRYDLKRDRLLNSYRNINGSFKLEMKNFEPPIYLRDKPSSDYDVYKQIFHNAEYAIALDGYLCNFYNEDLPFIIDAGANVGYTSLYFYNVLRTSQIVCIEADKDNFEILERNVSRFEGIYTELAALCPRKGMSFSISSENRDGNDWSKKAVSNNEGSISGITIQDILTKYGKEFIDILKIDIEGGEKDLFAINEDISFLDRTKVLVIEIHDEYASRQHIYKILRSKNFQYFNHEELTFAFNKNSSVN